MNSHRLFVHIFPTIPSLLGDDNRCEISPVIFSTKLQTIEEDGESKQ